MLFVQQIDELVKMPGVAHIFAVFFALKGSLNDLISLARHDNSLGNDQLWKFIGLYFSMINVSAHEEPLA